MSPNSIHTLSFPFNNNHSPYLPHWKQFSFFFLNTVTQLLSRTNKQQSALELVNSNEIWPNKRNELVSCFVISYLFFVFYSTIHFPPSETLKIEIQWWYDWRNALYCSLYSYSVFFFSVVDNALLCVSISLFINKVTMCVYVSFSAHLRCIPSQIKEENQFSWKSDAHVSTHIIHIR